MRRVGTYLSREQSASPRTCYLLSANALSIPEPSTYLRPLPASRYTFSHATSLTRMPPSMRQPSFRCSSKCSA
ncbi:hypothetical protein BDV95DRAFT_562564 [Massariosphaeria phaeospora]|uniref:Uncharacterized protein n=1 Tax=Massariosphaeria phaeospora TaxID=100035 RepID=A0A7C8IFB3_9PLEO|nr:hypothetical protein BDV95DRAFT_562564 [Massariosphaeria phaeospora]